MLVKYVIDDAPGNFHCETRAMKVATSQYTIHELVPDYLQLTLSLLGLS